MLQALLHNYSWCFGLLAERQTCTVYVCAGIKESVNMQHIKMHYYTSHPKLNYYAVVPKGLDGTDNKWWEQPHNRESHLGPVDV